MKQLAIIFACETKRASQKTESNERQIDREDDNTKILTDILHTQTKTREREMFERVTAQRTITTTIITTKTA